MICFLVVFTEPHPLLTEHARVSVTIYISSVAGGVHEHAKMYLFRHYYDTV